MYHSRFPQVRTLHKCSRHGFPGRAEEIITDLIKSVDFEIGLLTTVDGKTYEFEGRQGTGSIGESGKLTRDE